MLFIKILILIILLTIFIQDIISRSVYWIVFPLLIVLFVLLRIKNQSISEILQSILINCGFLLFNLVLVSLYFSLKKATWINITKKLLGWGDILFLTAIIFYLSTLNFIFFYLISLVFVLFFWLIWQLVVNKNNAHIPLAGMQALMLMCFLITDWWYVHCNLTDDSWLLTIVAK